MSPTWSVVIPCYNEEQTIAAVVANAEAFLDVVDPSGEILVVDDGSSDGSLEVIVGLKRSMPRLRVLQHSKNSGIGVAWRTLYQNARGRYVLTCPGDNQFDPRNAIRLTDQVAPNKLILICRQSRYQGYSAFRKVVSLASNVLSSIVCRKFVHDVNWVKVYPAGFLDMWRIQSTSPFIEVEIVAKAIRNGAECIEVDLPFAKRQGGKAQGARLKTISAVVTDVARYILGLSPPVMGQRPEVVEVSDGANLKSTHLT